MIEDIRPWRPAKQLIDRHGSKAEADMATRARAETGDLTRVRHRLHTLQPIRELSSSAPGGATLASQRLAPLALAAVMTATLFTSAIAAPTCIRANERVALGVRAVQTHLMVAALSCNFRPEYNNFVLRFRPELDRDTIILHRFFRRAYGSHAISETTRYFTHIANRASLISVSDFTGFCDWSAAILSAARGISPRRLEDFTRTQEAARRAERDFEVCNLAKH